MSTLFSTKAVEAAMYSLETASQTVLSAIWYFSSPEIWYFLPHLTCAGGIIENVVLVYFSLHINSIERKLRALIRSLFKYSLLFRYALRCWLIDVFRGGREIRVRSYCRPQPDVNSLTRSGRFVSKNGGFVCPTYVFDFQRCSKSENINIEREHTCVTSFADG